MTLDDATLSAYLTGDLDDLSSRRVEAALRDDPALGRRLDEITEVVWALQGATEAELPAGFDDRLSARLADLPVAEPSTRRPQRVASRRWLWTGSAAAGVVAAAVLGVSALSGIGGEGADMAGAPEARDAEAMLESAEAPTTMEAPAEQDAPEASTDSAAGADEALPEEETARAQELGGPVVGSGSGRIAEEAEVADRYADLPEVAGLLGLGVEPAADVATANLAILEESPLPDGTPAARCIADVTQDLPYPHVIARVELVEYQSVPAVAHVLVIASGAGVLDRVEVRIAAVDGCTVLSTTELP